MIKFEVIKELFKYDDAKYILNFNIKHINKNLEINNQLFDKKISNKLLKKVKKINRYYSDFNIQDYEIGLNCFLKKMKTDNEKEPDFDEKLIAYMTIASEKIYGQTPRLIQIICLLYYLEGYIGDFGLILEVLTGEGKTLTISFLALYLAILGNKVDILTSSPILSERDAKNRKKFFNFFDISCDFCRNDTNRNEDNMFECYKADIVYGDGISLIGDILRSNFLGKKGRKVRKYND